MTREFCARAGLGFVETPGYTERTIERGVAVSPEHLCFPMKVLLGSAIDALEAGADTLLTVAGYGACRFNYFAEIQRRILEREGYDFRIVVFDSPRDSFPDFYRNLKVVKAASDKGWLGLIQVIRLALHKGWAWDEIEKHAMSLRALEREEGAVDGAARECLALLDAAGGVEEVEEARAAIAEGFARVPLDRERPHLRMGIIGELMMCMEPYFNFDIERWLAGKGVVLERSLYMSDIFTPRGRNPVSRRDDGAVWETAAPYLCHEIGGHGQINVAAAVDYARRGFDAVVHFFPFTCLPEIIAKTVFVRISRDFGIPVFSFSIDEQTGRAGLETRLEALVDLAWEKARRRS